MVYFVFPDISHPKNRRCAECVVFCRNVLKSIDSVKIFIPFVE